MVIDGLTFLFEFYVQRFRGLYAGIMEFLCRIENNSGQAEWPAPNLLMERNDYFFLNAHQVASAQPPVPGAA